MESTILIVGLGNPGQRYEGTRHNVGFWLLDALARRHGLSWAAKADFQAEVARFERGGRRVFLAKPQTYVNLSGSSAAAICRYYRIEPASSLVVVHDEINLDVGRLKISLRGGAGGHNGVADIIRLLGAGFIRFRVGIGPRHPPEIALTDFVLGKFPGEQADILRGKETEFLDLLQLLVDSGPVHAMNRVNRKERKTEDEPKQSELQSDICPGHEGQDGVCGGSDRAAEKGD